MKLYHGSTMAVRKPVVSRGRTNTDFGKGFYTTTSKEQAEKWARIKRDREGAEAVHAIVSVYEFDDSLFDNPLYKTVRFDGATVEWLDFVVGCRRGATHNYDIMTGPVANDKLYATIALYENGVLDANAAIEQLKTHTLYDQVSFHNQQACNLLDFVESYEIIS